MAKKVSKKKKKKSVNVDAPVVQQPIPRLLQQKENRQLFWFFVIVFIAFAAVLVPYFYAMSQKTFEYEMINWSVETVGSTEVYHGRFLGLSGRGNFHNIYLRHDPRENDVSVSGALDSFKFGGIVSISPRFDACRGDIPRAMVDFFSFLSNGIGMAEVAVATTSKEVANSTQKPFVDCSHNESRTVFMMDLGDVSEVRVSEENSNCYHVVASSCSDFRSIEKFMVRTVSDFRQKHSV